MVKRILVGLVLLTFITSCFAGYSGGGRSGFSGGQSFSASRSYSSASVGRSGYSRSTNTTRAYVAPRTYSRSYSGTSSNTIIHNNNYSHGGFGGGGGFFSGFLGGYLGGSLAGAHHAPVVVSGGTPVLPQGQGMLVEGGGYVPMRTDPFAAVLTAFFSICLIIILICGIVKFIRWLFVETQSCSHNRW